MTAYLSCKLLWKKYVTSRKLFLEYKWSEVAQSCPTLCNPMDSSLPGSAVHGISQARILEWAAISFSRGSSQSRDGTRVSYIADRHFTIWATREAFLEYKVGFKARTFWPLISLSSAPMLAPLFILGALLSPSTPPPPPTPALPRELCHKPGLWSDNIFFCEHSSWFSIYERSCGLFHSFSE